MFVQPSSREVACFDRANHNPKRERGTWAHLAYASGWDSNANRQQTANWNHAKVRRCNAFA